MTDPWGRDAVTSEPEPERPAPLRDPAPAPPPGSPDSAGSERGRPEPPAARPPYYPPPRADASVPPTSRPPLPPIGRPASYPPPAPADAVPPPSPPAARSAPPRRTAPATPVRRGPRRARLTVKRVDPWSVLKFTFVYSLAVLVIGLVAVVVLYGVLDALGVFHSLNTFLHDINPSGHTFTQVVSFGRVVGWALVLGVVNVVLFTALATLGAFLYNLCADMVGGVELTLSERE